MLFECRTTITFSPTCCSFMSCTNLFIHEWECKALFCLLTPCRRVFKVCVGMCVWSLLWSRCLMFNGLFWKRKQRDWCSAFFSLLSCSRRFPLLIIPPISHFSLSGSLQWQDSEDLVIKGVEEKVTTGEMTGSVCWPSCLSCYIRQQNTENTVSKAIKAFLLFCQDAKATKVYLPFRFFFIANLKVPFKCNATKDEINTAFSTVDSPGRTVSPDWEIYYNLKRRRLMCPSVLPPVFSDTWRGAGASFSERRVSMYLLWLKVKTQGVLTLKDVNQHPGCLFLYLRLLVSQQSWLFGW